MKNITAETTLAELHIQLMLLGSPNLRVYNVSATGVTVSLADATLPVRIWVDADSLPKALASAIDSYRALLAAHLSRQSALA